MNCPLYQDFTRECIAEIDVYPKNITEEILTFCSSNKHKECPFYKMLIVKKNVCKNIRKCPAFVKFQIGGFDEFAKISNEYCTSKDYVKCKRFVMKKNGEEPPIWLHPSGEHVKDWEE